MKNKIYTKTNQSEINYLKNNNFIKSDNFKKVHEKIDIYRNINFLKRSVLLQSTFEIENKLINIFNFKLKNFATLKLCNLNRKTVSKYIDYKKSNLIINMFNDWFNDGNRNYKLKHKSKKSVNVGTVFQKISLGQKITVISNLNKKNKDIFLNNNSNLVNNNKKIDLLHMLKKIRNYLSHEYWCLDSGWIKGIIYNKNPQYNIYNDSPMSFFNELNKYFMIFEDNIYINTKKIVFNSLNLKERIYLYLNNKKIFDF